MPVASFQRLKSATRARARSKPSYSTTAHSLPLAPVLHPVAQAKLRISAAGDEYEQEAERVADRVMRMPELSAFHAPIQPNENLTIQRAGATCQSVGDLPTAGVGPLEDASAKPDETASQCGRGLCPRPIIESSSSVAGGPVAPLSVESLLQSPGAPLDGSTRGFMELCFGQDLDQVRIHTGEQAGHAARAVHARAFTVGCDVVFGAGEYAPATPDGRRLLAHELTHVLQQSRGHGLAQAAPQRLQRQEAEAPDSVEQDGEPAVTVDEEESQISATELDTLVAEALAAGRHNAPERLAKVAAFTPLAAAVARLDGEEKALGHLLKVLGPDAWLAENRANLLAILPLRTPERNVETIQDEMDQGLLQLDFRLSADEAHMVYEVLKAMSAADRARFLVTAEGQEAFERMGERASCELRISREFGFYDADVEALLAELENLETWSEERRGWLRTVFVMLVQSGHASDPRVVTFVQHNWELEPEFFAAQGFSKQGELAPEDLRDTPNPRWLHWFTKVGLIGLWADAGGTLQLGLQFAGGKRSHVEGLPVANIPLGSVVRGLGGSLFGIDLEEIPGIEDSGLASVSIDETEGTFILEVTSAAIPTLDLMGKGEEGATFTITATNSSFGGLRVEAHWPARQNPTEIPSLKVHVDWLGLGATILSSGNLLVGADRLQLQNLDFDASVSAASENGKFKVRKFVGNLQDQLAAVVSVLQSALFAFVPPALF